MGRLASICSTLESMGLLDRFAVRLEYEDPPLWADAIIALDGGEGDNRIARALDLLRRDYAPRLILSENGRWAITPDELAEIEGPFKWKICWLSGRASSTREEAVEARQLLNRLGCSSVLVVTSSYHTRRAREIFARELNRDGIKVRVMSAGVRGFDMESWWKSQVGRATILLEYAKLLCVRLHFDLGLTGSPRDRLKRWVQRTIP